MPKNLSPAEAMEWLLAQGKGPGLVYAAGCAGEPTLFAETLVQLGPRDHGLTFTGVWIPGVNKIDWGALGAAETFFLSPALRPSFEAGRTRYLPRAYTDIYPYLETAPLRAAMVQVSPPNAEGLCSLGVANDFTPAVLGRGAPLVAHLNPAMPFIPSAETIPYEDIDVAVEAERPLLTYDAGTVTPDLEAIAQHIADLLPPNPTLQFGLGKVQKAVLEQLQDRSFSIHAGMISDPVLPLLDKVSSITTGVALGSPALYEAMLDAPQVQFAPVSHTHDIGTLRSLPNLVAINSVVEVDLFGQANAEFVGQRQMSGAGGLVDFLRGARLAGGLPIIALPSTAKKGTVSRIVPHLAAGLPASIARGDECIVVTEQGVADLRGLDIEAKARALIKVAHPQHRDALTQKWTTMRSAL
mgnify:CR=1 FL=1